MNQATSRSLPASRRAGDTKTRILDAAEKLFSEHGFAGTSVRAITAEANVNLAAVHYHFGSKEAVIRAVFARRLNPLNEERLERLDAAEAKAGGKPVPLKTILEAFIGPVLRLRRGPAKGGARFMRLMGRTFTESGDLILSIFLKQFGTVAKRFTAALHKTLPSLPSEELFWRMHFMIGTMAHTMADTFRLKMLSRGTCDASDTEAVLARLVAFVAAGMQAPLPVSGGKRRKRRRSRRSG
jgi:AcrR family transcriptional regulator